MAWARAGRGPGMEAIIRHRRYYLTENPWDGWATRRPLPGVFHPVFACGRSRAGPSSTVDQAYARQHSWSRDLARFRRASVALQASEGHMAKVPTVKLNDGSKIPQLGLGVW
ncbi:hypothetical protein, partial [Achromobacter insuavis]|uniref:hypothetical protein n=1 Tax=Achromobacter insuavis TaxID=1287735 RepID=UPI001F13F232